MEDNTVLLKTAVMWYGVSFLPRLRRFERGHLKRVLFEASDINQEHPVHLIHEKRLVCPSWSDKPLTGGEIIALMVFGLFVYMGEDETMCSPLLEAWPIKEAVQLVE